MIAAALRLLGARDPVWRARKVPHVLEARGRCIFCKRRWPGGACTVRVTISPGRPPWPVNLLFRAPATT